MPSTPKLEQRSDLAADETASHHVNTPAYQQKQALGPARDGVQPSAGLGKALSPKNGVAGATGPLDYDGYKVPALPASANGNGKATSLAALQGSRNGAVSVANGATNGSHRAAGTSSSTVLPSYSLLFEPQSSRAWEKSRQIEGGNDQQQPTAAPSRDELVAGLRPEEEGLVPLNAIAGRVVHYAWQLFANQVEINPSISPFQRRKRIYDDAHEARKQLIKLLVLVQWSQAAPELQVARNLITLINDQIAQTDAAVASISETRSVLSSARLRNYDLVTAIEILTRGGPQRIPPLIKDHIHAQKPFTDDEAIAIVGDLDEVLRLRLASEEVLAMPMLSYTISDGRACFVAPSLFEADLTLSGPSPDDRWWLLRVKFDFRITGSGTERFPRQLRGQQRLNLLELADSELAPRSIAVATDADPPEAREMGGGEASSQREEAIECAALEQRKDAPLVRLYNLLQSQSLHYRLDILHWQAVQLIKLSWGQRLTAFVDASRVLHLKYWRNARATQKGTTEEWDPCSNAEIRISVLESDQHQGSTSIIKSLFEKNDERRQKPQNLRLGAEWDIKGVVLDFLSSRDLVLDHRQLDAEALLLDITRRHSKAAIDAFRARIELSPLSKTMKVDVKSEPMGSVEESSLLIMVHERLTVELSIDRISGHIRLEERSADNDSIRNETLSCATLASLTRLDHVRDASKAINDRPRTIVGVLQRLRCQILIEDLEEKCALAGLPCTTRMPLRQVDYAQLQGVAGTLLFVALQQCPAYYLVLQVGDESIRVALMCAGTFLEDMITSMRIVSLERLDWIHVLRSCSTTSKWSTLGKRKRDKQDDAHVTSALTMSEDDLAILHSYSVALICYHKIEEQLRQRSIPFLHVGGLTKRKLPSIGQRKDDEKMHLTEAVEAIIPSLCIDARAFLGALEGSLVKRNILLRLREWNDPLRCRVELSLKVALRSEIVARDRIIDGSDEVRYDAKAGVLTFSIADIDNCFVGFLTHWRRIEKVLDLVKVLWWLKKQQKAQSLLLKGEARSFFAVEAFDLAHVRFQYDTGLVAKVGWMQDLSKRRAGYFALAFTTRKLDPAEPNPHSIMRQALQQALNRGDETKPTFWPSFLNLMRRTLPIAKVVHRLPDRCVEDVRTPELEVKSASWVRLTFLDRFILDVRLLRGQRVLICDAGRFLLKQSSEQGDRMSFDEAMQDEFSLAMLHEDAEAVRAASEWAAIPSFETIVTDLAVELPSIIKETPADERTKASILPFPNALLYRGEASHVEWLLTQLMEKVRLVLDE